MNTNLHQIREAYKSYSIESSEVDTSNLQWQMILDIYLQLPKNAKILDAGCGDGKYIRALNQIGDHEVIGIDLFKSIQNQTNNYICGDVNNLSFENESFNFIYSISVINYCENHNNTLLEWFRVLKPNGFIILSGHTKFSVFTFIRIIKKMFFRNRYPHLENISFHNPNDIISSVKSIGFEIVKKSGFFVSWADRLLNRKIVSAILDRLCSDEIKFKFGYHFILVLKK